MRKWDALENLGMVLLTEDNSGFDLIDSEIPTTPDYVAIASALEASLRSRPAFGLSLATCQLNVLKQLDAVALLSKPVDSIGGDVRIHNDAAAGLPSPDDDYTEFVPKL